MSPFVPCIQYHESNETSFNDCYNCCYQYKQAQAQEEAYSAPLPWIGLYVAAASLVCSLAMVLDVSLGFRHKRYWFPCKFFTLNAASLTILAVAMKIPVDLSTSMPLPIDQLVKLSSIVFMSTTMGNFMPSLGQMSNKEIISNVAALGILVITIFVNLCIQLFTGVIFPSTFALLVEQSVAMFLMIACFVILTFSALSVPTTTKYLSLKYNEMHKQISSKEEFNNISNSDNIVEKLKEDIKKYWLMAETGNLQFVVARSVTCFASGIICVLSALTLIEADYRLLDVVFRESVTAYGSNYKWSTLAIFVCQNVGVGVCTIALAFRWFTTIKLNANGQRGQSFKAKFIPEKYWTEKLEEWRESPISLKLRGKICRKFVHITRNFFLGFCIKVQLAIVVMSKAIQLLSVLLVMPFLSFYRHILGLRKQLIVKSTIARSYSNLEPKIGRNLDPRCFVLYLEGENELPKRTLKKIGDSSDRFIQMGRKQQPKVLLELLQKSTGFNGLTMFDNREIVKSLDCFEPPNSWMLPVVTLTSIAIALPNVSNQMIERLLHSVSESLAYITHVEKVLDAKDKELTNIKNAAKATWLGVELYGKWLDHDIRKMAFTGKHSNSTLRSLSGIAKSHVMEFKGKTNGSEKDNPLNWPGKVIAANSMYRISQTLLLDYKLENESEDVLLFEKMSIMISDILAACFTNLPRVIIMKCFNSETEKKMESVEKAAHLLGETEEILNFLQKYERPNLHQDQTAYIDEWRASIKKHYPLPFETSFCDDQIGSSCCGEIV